MVRVSRREFQLSDPSLQLGAQELHELEGEHGDEQVAIGALFLGVIDRAQAQLRLEAPEHGLQIGEHEVGSPQRLGEHSPKYSTWRCATRPSDKRRFSTTFQ